MSVLAACMRGAREGGLASTELCKQRAPWDACAEGTSIVSASFASGRRSARDTGGRQVSLASFSISLSICGAFPGLRAGPGGTVKVCVRGCIKSSDISSYKLLLVAVTRDSVSPPSSTVVYQRCNKNTISLLANYAHSCPQPGTRRSAVTPRTRALAGRLDTKGIQASAY